MEPIKQEKAPVVAKLKVKNSGIATFLNVIGILGMAGSILATVAGVVDSNSTFEHTRNTGTTTLMFGVSGLISCLLFLGFAKLIEDISELKQRYIWSHRNDGQ